MPGPAIFVVAPSPKSQYQLVIVPVEVSVKVTKSGAVPLVGLALNCATTPGVMVPLLIRPPVNCTLPAVVSMRPLFTTSPAKASVAPLVAIMVALLVTIPVNASCPPGQFARTVPPLSTSTLPLIVPQPVR